MYIANTTDNVRKIFDYIEKKDNLAEMKFLIYLFNGLNNNQINNQNEVNPDLIEDESLEIFNFQSIGFENNFGTLFLQHLSMIYNKIDTDNEVYEKNGNIYGITFDDDDKKNISDFEKLSFEEKLDVFSEIIIRWDNETLLSKYDGEILNITFSKEQNGFEIARMIQEYKKAMN